MPKDRWFNIVVTVASLCGVLILLAACGDMYMPGTLNNNRLQVKEEKFSEATPVAEADERYVSSVAEQYARSGGGGMDISVTYDPASASNTAMQAGGNAARIAAALRKQGVADIKAGVLPVRGQGEESLALVSYDSWAAEAPEDCGTLPGFDSTDIDHKEDYKMGCTVETVFARQIARPKDLAGHAPPDPRTDGRRAANVVEVYRTGAPNEPLEGQTASEN